MKKALIALVIIIVGIQFIPLDQTNPPITSEISAPENVKVILKKACYDCHSNETNWAWYTKIAPASFLATKDVNDGRKHLNFSEWNVDKENKYKEEIWEEIREEQMPPWQYKIIHSESKLSQEEKNIIRNWAGGK